MSENTANSGDMGGHEEEPSRRDFLYLATGMAAVVGAGSFVWPFIDQMRPDASTLAQASIDVNVSALEPGMSLTVKWRGKPVFIRHRTDAEIAQARSEDVLSLPDTVARNPNISGDDLATDANRAVAGNENFLVMIGVCTHLGCVPLGDGAGDFGGWFCPCHGSHYDISGRIRKGPAPTNMEIPKYEFVNSNTIKIG